MADFGISFGVGLGLQLLGGILTPPRQVGRLENRALPDASYNSEISKGYGIFPFRASMIQIPEELTERRNTRGKIGGKTIEFSYSATMGFITSEGPIIGFPYVTLNSNQFIDLFSEETSTLEESQQNLDRIITRLGTPTQLPIGALQAIRPDGIAPPNRDMAMIALPNWNLTEDLGNRPPTVQGVVATSGRMEAYTFNRETPQPVSWAGVIGSDLSLTNYAAFDAPQVSPSFTTPADPIGYHIAAKSPEFRLTQTPITTTFRIYHDGANNWEYQAGAAAPEQLLIMSAADVAKGAFYDIEINQNEAKFSVNGQLIRSVFLGVNQEYTLTVDSIDWGGIEVPLSTPVNATRFIPELVPLAGILTSICDEAGLQSNTDEINDLVLGVSLQGESPREWIEQLQSIYAFLVVDKGGVIYFLNGDRPADVFIQAPLEDFGIENEDLYQMLRTAPEEVPYQCNCTYYDLEDHQEKPAYYRLDSHDENDRPYSNQILPISTSAVMTEAEALGIAELTLIRAQAEREEITLRTNFKYWMLEPGDVLQLPLFNNTVDLLIAEANIGADYVIEFKAYRYARDAWAAKVTPVMEAVTPIQSANEYARLYLNQSLPKLNVNHPDNVIYMGVSHQVPNYRDVSVIGSIDGGNSYAQLFNQRNLASVGVAAGLDIGSDSVVVRVSGELSTLTDASFDNNRALNRIAIGNEVIQYKVATLLGRYREWNYYQLSTLRRAQLSTTEANHSPWAQMALTADLEPVDPTNIGEPGTNVLIDLLTDGNEQPLNEATLTL